MTDRRSATYDDPPDGCVDVPSLPFSPETWKEALAWYTRDQSRSPEGLEKLGRHLERECGQGQPLRKFIGFVQDPAEVALETTARAPRTYVRVLARCGFEARKAVLAHFGCDLHVSIWDPERMNAKR